MYGDLATHFHDGVLGAFVEYMEVYRTSQYGRSRHLRAAIDAATALFHFREHLPAARAKTFDEVTRDCPDYGLLGNVVNASKHGSITRNSPRLSTAPQIEERLVITRYKDGQGEYEHAETRVVLRLDAGGERDLLDVLIAVMNYWSEEMATLGLVEDFKAFTHPAEKQPRPREDCNHGIYGLEIVRGLPFKLRAQIRQFNYETGTVEAIDLTGWAAEFQVFKPAGHVRIEASNPGTGDQFDVEVPLTAQEVKELEGLGSDEEKAGYLSGLPRVRKAIRTRGVSVPRLPE